MPPLSLLFFTLMPRWRRLSVDFFDDFLISEATNQFKEIRGHGTVANEVRI